MTIEGGAFSNCSGLTNITIPGNVLSIGEKAFKDCSGLTSIIIPDSVESIGDLAFQNCSALTNITIPSKVSSIYRAFYGCRNLSEITFLGDAPSISNGFDSNIDPTATVYYDPNSHGWSDTFDQIPTAWIGSIDFEYGIEDDNEGNYFYVLVAARNGLSGSISIPSTYNGLPVTTIGEEALKNFTGITNVDIPNSVISIKSGAFESCTGLISIAIPDSVSSIGGYAFRNCSGLTSVTIPDSVSSIGDSAFQNCSGLTSILICLLYTSDAADD